MWTFGRSALDACAHLAIRRRWWVVGVSAALTLLMAYCAAGLTISSSTEGFLARSLPFRQAEIAYAKAFPPERAAIVAIDAGSADEATAAARALAERLSGRPEQFTKVGVAGDSPYFEDNALLFLDAARLRALAAEITQAQPLVSALQSDTSLRGLARVLGQIEAAGPTTAPPAIGQLLAAMAATAASRAEGGPAILDWGILFDSSGGLAGTRRLLLATPAPDDRSFDRFGAALRTLADDVASVRGAYPGATFQVTGEPALQQQELDDAFSGALTASILSFFLVAASLVIGIRSGRMIAVLVATLIVGSVWTTGLAALTIGELNLISVAFMVLFFGLGIDFGTHLGLRYLEEVRAGRPVAEALRASIVGEGPSIALSALCAALAFLSFVPTSYVAMAQFGIISALGMLVAVVLTFTFQPAMMAILPPRPVRERGAGFKAGAWIERHHKAVLAAAAAATIAAAVAAPGARIDVDPLNLQNPTAAPVVAYRSLAADPQTSPYALNVLAPNLDAARALAGRLREVSGVAGVRTIESFVPADQDEKIAVLSALMVRLTASAPTDKVTPPDDAALAQAFADMRRSAGALAETATGSETLRRAARALSAALDLFAARQETTPDSLRFLEDGLVGGFAELAFGLGAKLSIGEPVTLDDIPEDLRRNWVTPEGAVRISILPASTVIGLDALEAFADRVGRVAPQAAGIPAILIGAGQAILRSFAEAILVTAVGIALVVALMRRRAADVALVLAPLVVASIWTVAAASLLGLPFNFANVIVIPLLIGLGVAGSVHIVSRARDMAADGARSGAVMETSTSLAVLVAQLNTVAAFATLAVSSHRGLYSMGLLLGLAILFVLVASLLVLPALLVALDRRPRAA